MSTAIPALFPMFVKLAGRRCLVVGGGAIAESKVQSLLNAGGHVTVVSPTLTSDLASQEASGSFAWESRKFRASDLDDVFLVIAATSDKSVNDSVFCEADRRGILCNAVDQPSSCHFYFPAVVRRGSLQIAISTAGLSPSLAQRLRKQLEAEFGHEYGEWLRWLGAVRGLVRQRTPDFHRRRRLLAYISRQESFERWRTSNQERA